MLILNKLNETQIRQALTTALEAFANIIRNATDFTAISVVKTQLVNWNFRISRWIAANYCNPNVNSDFLLYMLYVQYRLHQAIEFLHLMELNEDLDARYEASYKIRSALITSIYSKPADGYNIYYIPAPKCDRKNVEGSLYIPSNVRLQLGKRYYRHYYLKFNCFTDSNRLTILPRNIHNYLRLKLVSAKKSGVTQQEIANDLKEFIHALASHREVLTKILKNQSGRIKYVISDNSKELAKMVVREAPTKLSNWKEFLQHVIMQILANDNIVLLIENYKVAIYFNSSIIRYSLRVKSINELNSIILSLLLTVVARMYVKWAAACVRNFTPLVKSNCSFATQCSYNPGNPKLPVSVMPVVQHIAGYLEKQFEDKHCKFTVSLK